MPKNDDRTVSERIDKESGGLLEYVSGYENKESQIVVRCKVCEETFCRTFHHLTTHKPVICPVCIEKARERIRTEQEEAAELRRSEREAARLKRQEEEEERRAAREHACPVCGKLTVRPKYCSEECMKRAANKAREHRRRTKITEALVDADITVDGLFKRDKGTCYLCGGKCDYEDFTVVNGNFIAGDWYPSIDHVIPLAKGGAHSWANVRLAHRRCNYLKSDK